MPLKIDQLHALGLNSSPLLPLIDYLRQNNYTPAGVARLVGESDPDQFIKNAGFCALLYDEACREDGSPLALLAQLFMMGGRVPKNTYELVFPSKIRELFERQKLVRGCQNDCVTAEIGITEFESFHFFSDKLFENFGDARIEVLTEPDVVWPMAEWSLNLFRNLAVDPRWTSFLDIGCGSGCHSILARHRYSNTVGIDLNPRAVAFSRLNAVINRTELIRHETADCFAFGAGANAERYDHIVFAAPGGPNMDNDNNKAMVSNGGRLGHELLLRFISKRAEQIMSRCGCCQIWGIFAVEERHGSLQGLLESSLPESLSITALDPFRDGGLYIPAENIKGGKLPQGCHYVKPDQWGSLLEGLRKNRINEVVSALVTLRFKDAAGTVS